MEQQEALKSNQKKEKSESKEPGYIEKSMEQIAYGNYSKNATLLRTAGQIALGFTGADAPGDLRDVQYDVSNLAGDLDNAWNIVRNRDKIKLMIH